MMKIKYIIISIILSLSLFNFANASLISDTKTEVLKTVSSEDLKTNLTRADFFNFFSEYYLQNLPKSYKYISLKFSDVKTSDSLYIPLQKLVYIDALDNKKIKVSSKKNITTYGFYSFAEKVLGEKLIESNEINSLKSTYANLVDLYTLKTLIEKIKAKNEAVIIPEQELTQKAIFDDVYNTIISSHYNNDNISKTDMMYSAIEGLATGTKDKFTTYFPPVQKKQFSESLSGEYEGIGAYVDMTKPGEFKIVSPLSGSPAEKAGLKAQDIITKIDNFEITKDTTSDEAVSKIKGTAGTIVSLTIKRGNDTLIIKVTRAKVTLKDVEGKSLSDEIYYMNLRMFGEHVVSDFKKTLEDMKTKTNTKKLIIDLRNNPGGYLDSVSEILSYFVPAGEPVAIVKYKNYNQDYNSLGYTDYDFSKLKIVILVNGGSASASEIMAGTLKDYFSNITLIGEKTYGKGSVQTIKTYYDGSSLKYTIAKWFTGKTQIGIDGTGIKVDKEVILDGEKIKTGVDNQLEEAKKL